MFYSARTGANVLQAAVRSIPATPRALGGVKGRNGKEQGSLSKWKKAGIVGVAAVAVAEVARPSFVVQAEAAEESKTSSKTMRGALPTVALGGASDIRKSAPPPKKKKLKGGTKKLPNPGRYDDAESDLKEFIEPHAFSGARFSFQKQVWPQPQTGPDDRDKQLNFNATVMMGSQQLRGGHSSDLQIDCKLGKTRKHELAANINGAGRLSGKYKLHRALGFDRLRLEAGFQIFPDQRSYNGVDLKACWKGDNYTFEANLANQGGQSVILSFLQSVTPKLAAGVQVLHLVAQETALAGVLRYKDVQLTQPGQPWPKKGDVYTLTATSQQGGIVSVGYGRFIGHVGIGTQIHFSNQTHDTLTQLAAIWTQRTYRFSVGLTTKGDMSSSLEQVIAGTPATFILCGELSHQAGQSCFGFGVSM